MIHSLAAGRRQSHLCRRAPPPVAPCDTPSLHTRAWPEEYSRRMQPATTHKRQLAAASLVVAGRRHLLLGRIRCVAAHRRRRVLDPRRHVAARGHRRDDDGADGDTARRDIGDVAGAEVVVVGAADVESHQQPRDDRDDHLQGGGREGGSERVRGRVAAEVEVVG